MDHHNCNIQSSREIRRGCTLNTPQFLSEYHYTKYKTRHSLLAWRWLGCYLKN
jgi:hypothetical protein